MSKPNSNKNMVLEICTQAFKNSTETDIKIDIKDNKTTIKLKTKNTNFKSWNDKKEWETMIKKQLYQKFKGNIIRKRDVFDMSDPEIDFMSQIIRGYW